MGLDDHKIDKLKSELIWGLTKQGAFQRSYIYRPKLDDNSKSLLRKRVKSFLYQQLYLRYKNGRINEDELLRIIDSLILEIELHFKTLLYNNIFQYGNAQKFVNLYLKYMWIIGILQEPPHFPVDRIIQRKIGTSFNWTNMNKEEYLNVIQKAKDFVRVQGSFTSIAEWEAIAYSRELDV